MKKVPFVITTPDAAARVVGLPLEATVAMADVAAAMRQGLLAFSTAAGLVVMQQMLTAELAGSLATSMPSSPIGSGTGMAQPRGRSCSVPARSAWNDRVVATPGGASRARGRRERWRCTRASPRRNRRPAGSGRCRRAVGPLVVDRSGPVANGGDAIGLDEFGPYPR